MRSLAPVLAFALLLGCYNWAPGGGLGGRGGNNDDDDMLPDDDDSAGDDDDDDASSDPCGDDVAAEALPIDDECRVDVILETEPELEIIWQFGAFDVEPAHDQVMMTPIVVPLTDDDGDGVPSPGDARAVIFTTYSGGAYTSNGILRALRGDGTSLLWTVTDPAWRLFPGANLAAGDIDHDGWPEIIGAHESGALVAFEHDGTPKWASSATLVGQGGAPFLADMDGDGEVEIVYQAQIFDALGNLLGHGAHGTGATHNLINYGASLVVDLDLDGDQEVVVGNALYDKTGAALWFNGEDDGCPGVGNFDADPEGEVVVISGGTVRLQDTDGTVIAGPVDLPGTGSGGPPTVADFDGDGMPEIGVANLGFYTMFDGDLSQLWSNPTEDDSSAITGSSAFDFDADGASEVVYADEHDVWVWHGAEGSLIHRGSGHASGTLIEYPVVAQVVASDGPPQIVVPSNNMWWEGWTGITLLADSGRSWVPTRQVWNQHAFISTHVEDDLSIPASPEVPWLNGVGYREGEATSVPGVAAPDLELELHVACPEQCVFRVRPLNNGINSGPFHVELLADGVPVDVVAHAGLQGGTRGEPIDLVIDGDVAAAAGSLSARIDVDDEVEECTETNNELALPAILCP